MLRFFARAVLLAASGVPLAVAISACEGCKSPSTPGGPAEAPPAARLYLVSDLAGALEPCGCVKDQLGGMDKLGALVGAERGQAKAAGVLSAGPLFFMDRELEDDRRAQEIAKAETIASSLRSLQLLAFAPARNDWAAGGDTLAKLAEASGAPAVAANVEASSPPLVRWTKVNVGALAIGVIGVSAPSEEKSPLPGVTSSPAAAAVRAGVEALTKDGARAIIALASVGRGEAKRIADDNPELLAIVVGSTGSGGDGNTPAPPAERVGDVLVVETANHLQTVAVLDLHPRDEGATGLVRFADATGIERARKREDVLRRIDELRGRIATWEKDKSVAPGDVEARRRDLGKLEAERDALEKTPPPASGSYFRYAMREVRESLGADQAVKAQMLSYYAKVNDANKVAFADRKPEPPAKGQPGYAGIDACTKCHEDARKVWNGTAHAHAYATLEKQHKEFNLDCVSCHVTGYDRPGGSTVTHVEGLKDVQCEVCHGPGKLHADKPDLVKIPIARPTPDSCLACHHPPHVHTFDAPARVPAILGPGHGRPAAR